MPGRPPARSARSSSAAGTRKSSSATTTKLRGASARTSANAVELPDEGPVTSLRTQICQIFSEAQRTTAVQRKLVVNLRNVQEACCYEPANPKKKRKEDEDYDETQFNDEVTRCVLRILSVKKSEPVGDRVVRFLGLFLQKATQLDYQIYQPEGMEGVGAPETPSSRLTSTIMSTLLNFLPAKDKVVRFRAVQTVSHIVNNLEQIDDDLFDLIRMGLLKRLRDKEASVRVQAALGLGRLAGNDDEEDDDEDSDDDTAGSILIKLLDIMQNDPSADVRRTVLSNLQYKTSNLPWIKERARDLDPALRRIVYGKILPTLGDFRHFSLVEREKLIRWGLRDRDDTVRKATARLFRERWLEDCAATHDPTPAEERAPGEVAAPNLEALLELLERIDVARSGIEGGMAHEAMREFWDGRPDYREYITFDDDFWNDLTAESAFIARSLNDYCRGHEEDRIQDILEDKMPVVTKFAFFVQKYLNDLIELVNKTALMEEDDPDAEEAQEEEEDQDFIVQQLLHIALTLDYTDEVGRRQMFSIMREAIARAQLPEECTKLAVEVLRMTCGTRGEADFLAVIVEAIAEVRDTLMDDEDDTIEGGDGVEGGEDINDSFHSAQSDISEGSTIEVKAGKKGKEVDPEKEEETRIRTIMVYSKCLHIAQCTLQNVHCDLEQNNSLTSMLNTLIVPAIRNQEAMIRERGIVCLGLCSLLSKNLASSNLELFMHCFAQGHDALKEIVIQVLADIIITHPALLAPVSDPDDTTTEDADTDAAPKPNPLVRGITKTFLKAFNSENRSLSLMACTAASKLLLLNILPPAPTADILKAFTRAYFNPETAANPALRQALSYFLPVFCHSKLKNALLMAQIAVAVVYKLLALREDPADDDDAMVSWPVICAHLAEWTDGRKVVGATELGLDGKMASSGMAEEPHVCLAIEVLERALNSGCSKDERKPLLGLLTKLHIAPAAPPSKAGSQEGVDEDTLTTLHALVTEAVEAHLAADATSRNYLAKLDASLTKRLGDVEPATQIPDQDDEDDGEGEATEVPREHEHDPEQDEDGDGHRETDIGDEITLASLQGEGTRMPLEDEDEEEGDVEDDDDVTMTGVPLPERRKAAVTESDIVDSLLDSEMDMEG